tara:strand:- start:400 stop:1020 length:621 start_codon:yes stop_codon:yes gene_type:complete
MMDETNKGLKRIKGRMLIAMPHMADPRFYKTTSAVLRHDASGASAVIFNKASKSLNLGEVCMDMGFKCVDKWKSQPIYYGGPVNTSQVFIIHSQDYHDKDTMPITTNISVTSSKSLLQLIGEDNGPKLFKVAIGCALWSPEQLDDELEGAWPRDGVISWIHSDLTPKDVYPIKDNWSNAIENYSKSMATGILKRLDTNHAQYYSSK